MPYQYYSVKERRKFYIITANKEVIKKSMNKPYSQDLIDACENFIKANDIQQQEVLDSLQAQLDSLLDKEKLAS